MATAEQHVDDEYIKRWEAYVQKWKRRTLGLATGLAISIACVIPFMAGHSLHQYFKEGEQLPDPRTDSSFQKYVRDEDFIKLMVKLGYK